MSVMIFMRFVCMWSYENEIVEQYSLVNETLIYGDFYMGDLIKVFSASLCGTVLAIGLAYWWKIDKIKQEPRRIL
jgi:hypothetical protein